MSGERDKDTIARPSPLLLGLRIDVDTYPGARLGLPWLLDELRAHSAQASVFLPGGPDRTARALFRVFTQRGYLSKLLRTDAFRVYGPTALKTALLHRNRAIADAHDAMRSVLADGHEIIAHGYTHTVWHNQLHRMDPAVITEHVVKSVTALENALGLRPKGFGGPGWQANFASLMALDQLGLEYGSDTRGSRPFMPIMNNYRFKTPQVPTTLPSLDEFDNGLPPHTKDMETLFQLITLQRYPVYAAHAELEGRFYRTFFHHLLNWCRKENITVVPLSTILARATSDNPLPTCKVYQGTVPGRPGPVAKQKGEGLNGEKQRPNHDCLSRATSKGQGVAVRTTTACPEQRRGVKE